MRAAPTAVPDVMDSPRVSAAKTTAHTGSVERRTVSSPAVRFARATLERTTVRAVDTNPAYRMASELSTVANATDTSGSDSVCVTNDWSVVAHSRDSDATVANCNADTVRGKSGKRAAAFSLRMNPMPNATACISPKASPTFGATDASDSSSSATPHTARNGAPNLASGDGAGASDEEEGEDGRKDWMIGTKTTAREHKKADLPASVPDSERDCVK